jgi:hypothetical protein
VRSKSEEGCVMRFAGFRVQGSEFRVQASQGSGFEFRVQGSGFCASYRNRLLL